MPTIDHPDETRIGLILSGGGARAAYQVGVLKAVAEIQAPKTNNPFPVLCGTSAGALNAAALSVYADDFQNAVAKLLGVWENFTVDQVFRCDFLGLSKSGAHWLLAMMFGGLGRYNPSSLFDRQPLHNLLAQSIPCHKIKESIDKGYVHALSITASGYTSGQSVTFYQSAQKIESWSRVIRIGCQTEICLDHLMASSAIPFIFKAVKINREYFGDGSMRQIAPISPALHMGANKLLVIGVRSDARTETGRVKTRDYPSMAQIGGHVLDSIFLDSMDIDLERLQRINRTLELIPKNLIEEGIVNLKPVDVMVISPSQDLGKIAEKHAHHLPGAVRFFLKGIGGLSSDGANLLSYLLFDKAYCSELITLGYADTINRREEVINFL